MFGYLLILIYGVVGAIIHPIETIESWISSYRINKRCKNMPPGDDTE